MDREAKGVQWGRLKLGGPWGLDRGAKWLQVLSCLWAELANLHGCSTTVEQKYLVERKRSSKNIWSSKIGRAKIFGRAKMVEQKKLVEQKAVQIVPPICPAGPSDGAAPLSKITTKPLFHRHFVFARANLLMNVFSQFWLSGGTPFRVSLGCHLVSHPWGTILGLRGVPLWVCRGVPSWTTSGTD